MHPFEIYGCNGLTVCITPHFLLINFFSFRKQCIISENRFDFLKDLVKSLPDVNTYDDDVGGAGSESSVPDVIDNIGSMANTSNPSLSSLR